MRIAHHSLAGGTDICSLFAGVCSALPVFRGEIQCRMLGMAVEAFTPAGAAARPGEAGALVCTRPFPCMPAGFWPLPGHGRADADAVPTAFVDGDSGAAGGTSTVAGTVGSRYRVGLERDPGGGSAPVQGREGAWA